MPRLAPALALGFALAALAGCATDAPTPEPVSPPSPTLPPIVGIGREEAPLRCGSDGLAFAARALRLAPPVEPAGFDDASAALAEQLRLNPPEPRPRTAWRRVAQDPQRVLFIADAPPGAGSPYLQLALARRDGAWDLDTVGACTPRVVFPEGSEPAEWWLDPDAEAPGPAGREVRALVQEIGCASGRPPVGRVLLPVVVYGADAVVVTFGVRTPAGDQDCQGAPPAPVTFTLEEPLGDRRLLDGGVFPPADAGVPGDDR